MLVRLRLIALLLSGWTVAAGSVEAGQPCWTLAVIGDQQMAVNSADEHDWLDRFTSQTEWLSKNAKSINLRMVVQVGDIVEHGADRNEYEQSLATMRMLDSAPNADGGIGIPWSVSYGNHEIIAAKLNPDQDLAGPGPSANYRHYFGSASGTHAYRQQPQFLGVSSNDLNTWHVVRASSAPDARSYLMLNLELDVPGKKKGTNFDAIEWAQQVINDHPGMATIVTTHVFEGSKFGPPNKPYLKGFGHNSQKEIFDKLIKNNPQIFLVLSGHTSEETHRVRTNAEGQPVLQMVTDYNKWLGQAGDGFFRRITIDEQAGKLFIQTYSALLDEYRTDDNGGFEVAIEFDDRFAAPSVPSSAVLR
jgi:hypothetical protein